MTEAPTISTAPPEHPSLDFDALRQEGLAYIEKYASQFWTDYNRHDPGITTLEMACYALTDVSLRASLPARDLLTSALGGPKGLKDTFDGLTAGRVLPTSPVTERDYRKLFIDVPGVQNAYLLAAQQSVFADFDQPDEHQRLSYTPQPAPAVPLPFTLNGLYAIRIAFDPAYIGEQARRDPVYIEAKTQLDPPTSTDQLQLALATATKQQEDIVLAEVMATYQAHRNLGEDVHTLDNVPTQDVLFCADVELEPAMVVSEVYAHILLAVERYLNPPVNRYSLAEMQTKTDASGQRLTIDQIFDGPMLKQGFILDDELDKASLRDTIYTSDLVNLILAIEIGGKKAVRVVRKVLLNYCDDQNKTGQRWCLHVKQNHQPRLCLDRVALAFYKDSVPVGSEADKVRAISLLDQLRSDLNQRALRQSEDLPVPTGFSQPLTTYRSIANDFPQTYGIGPMGLPPTATSLRRAQARQLKGYLLFFDQLLANYLQQLYQLGTLFSTRDSSETADFGRTYAGQPITDMADVASLWVDPATVQTKLQTVLDGQEGFTKNPDRRSRLLDHLLARFSEDFNEYALLMRTIFPKQRNDLLIDKARFLADYAQYALPKAYDYTKLAWANDNVAGVVRRIARLAGLDDFQAHPASTFTDTPDHPDGGAEAIFLIEHSLLRPQVLASSPYWLSLCLHADGTYDEPLDPYSYRLSLVLPGYTTRLSSVPFRQFLEKVIRLELPAHLLTRICWISKDQLIDFEVKYQTWLAARNALGHDPETPAYATARKDLIDTLEHLHTIYPPGVLHNCDKPDEENPLILGRSALGSLPSA